MEHLPHAARQDIKFWRERLTPVLSLSRGVTQALEQIAETTETPYPTVRRKFYALKERGVMALLDRRLAGPRYWKTKAERSTTLSEVDRAVVKIYAEDNSRSSRQAAKDMRKDWRTGKVRTTTATDTRTGYPFGWSLGNLAKHISDQFELAASRRGRALASSHRRLVYTTRKDLWVGSHYMFDDLWHDFFVNSFAEKQAGRPLELFSHDLFSARKVRWGIRVRTQKEDGTMHGLAENMTRYIVAATLYLDGYSKRGTVLVAEHGTAAIKGATKQKAGVYLRNGIDEALFRLTEGLVTVDRSGMQGAAPHAGQYPGIVRGNPRMKASLESSNNLTHNVFGALPGQTGPDRQRRPEQLEAMLRANDRMLALRERLPEASRALLDFPILEVNQFLSVAQDLYTAMENDPDHELEGWVECQHVMQEILLAGVWHNQQMLMNGSAEEQALALQLIGSGKIQTRPRRMSRREVWDRGSQDLVKLCGAGVVAILGEDLAKPRPIRKGIFEFEDAELGAGIHRYEGVVFDAYGRRIRLDEGETYEVFGNPFAPQRLFVCDSKLGYVGEAKRMESPSRANVEAVRRVMGAAAAEEAERLAGLRERHAGQAVAKRDREQMVADLESGNPVTEGHVEARRQQKTETQARETATRRTNAKDAAIARELLAADD